MSKLLKGLWKDVDQGENTNVHIREERKGYHLRISDTPWKKGVGEQELPVQESVDDEWSDLFLELTLATAYANLIQNTPIVDLPSAFSFLAFFALVWWIWASQVVYNIRFRTKDWVHRIFTILQFGIFGTLSAFTHNFNIFVGLLSDDSQPQNPPNFGLNVTDFNSVFASSLREERLPVLNAKGISVVLGISRLFLLIQYAIVFIYARREHRAYRRGLMVHLFTLGISTVAYFAAIGIIGQHPNRSNDIGKIFLWFAPMVLEIASHFFITTMKHVKIKPEKIHERSGSLFVVILGEELNQITGSFKYVIGTVGFTIKGAGLMAGTAIIVIGEFSLYARNNWKNWGGNKRGTKCCKKCDIEGCTKGSTEYHIKGSTNRTLLWFFSHFLLMATLILTLQGVQSLLSFANLKSTLDTLILLITDIAQKIHYNPGPSRQVTSSSFPEAANAFTALGLQFDDFLVIVNEAIKGGYQNTTSTTKFFQTVIYVGSVTVQEFDAFPERGTPLYNDIENFLTDPVVGPPKVYRLIGSFLAFRVNCAFYLWGTAGGTLVMLAILSMLKEKPTDKYECASILSRFMFGFIFMTFSGLTAHHHQPYYANGDAGMLHVVPAKAWKIASSAWLISSFAFTLILLNIIDIILEHHALKQYPPDNDEHSRPGSEKSKDDLEQEVGLDYHTV